jgi:hypothetical protein
MTKLKEVASITKLPRGQTVREMLDDINRLVKDNLKDDQILQDCFLVYVSAEGDISYIGQSIKACQPVAMIGILEIVKQMVLEGLQYE